MSLLWAFLLFEQNTLSWSFLFCVITEQSGSFNHSKQHIILNPIFDFEINFTIIFDYT